MRRWMVLGFVTLFGCASVHVHPDTGMEVRYKGTARQAAQLIQASDDTPARAMDLAEQSVNQGMPATVQVVNNQTSGVSRVSVTTGFGQGGFFSGNAMYVPGQGLVPTTMQSTLPPLAAPTSSVSTQAVVSGCPQGREPQTTEEVAECAYELGRTAHEDIKVLHP